MKNIYKISLLLVAFLAFTSCALDDDAPASNSNSVSFVSLDKTGQITTTGTAGESVNITLSQALDTDTKVEYSLNGTSTVAFIEAGSMSFPLNFPTDIGIVNSVVLSSATGLYNNVTLGDNKSVVFVGLPAAATNDIVVMMTNSSNTGDIWLGLSQFSSDGSSWIADYEGSINGQNPRISNIPLSGAGAFGAIPNSADVDPNIIAINLYPQGTLAQDPTTYSIFVVMPDNSNQFFTGTIPSAGFVDNAVVKVTVEDDPANAGMKLYTFSSL